MEFRDYVRVIRARKWLVIVPVLIGVLVAIGFSLLQEPTYRGVAKVVVAQQNTGMSMLGIQQADSYTPGRDDVQTQVEVIKSRQIAARVRDTLGRTVSVEGLLSQIDASADTGTNVISIRALDGSPSGAAAIANAFARAYIAWSRDNQRASIKAAADDVEARLTQAQADLTSAERTAPGSQMTAADQARLQAARDLYSRLADSLQELLIAEQLSTGKGSLLATATSNPSPVSPDHRRNAMLGLAIGLLVGLGVAFAAEHLDTRIDSANEASAICGAPVLANIPTEKPGRGQPVGLTLTQAPHGPAAESYRMLRNNLDFMNVDDSMKVLLVTSAVPREGKSTVAANLATACSQTGRTVMLVVCDFRLPTIDKFFKLERPIGLSEVLNGSFDLWMAAQKPEGHENLWVLSAGTTPPNPGELLQSAMMGRIISDLRGSVDMVILDSAPVLAAADAIAVSRWVDGILAVARVGVSRRDSMAAACVQLSNVGARILGLAVLGPMDTVATRGYYGYTKP